MPPGEEKTNGLWVWDEPIGAGVASNIIESHDEFITFLNSPHGNTDRAINRVFFQISLEKLDSSQPKTLSLINSLHEKGIKIDLLVPGNKGSWLLDDNLSDIPKNYCNKLAIFNDSVGSAEKIDGIHFDIEPHADMEIGEIWRTRGNNIRENFNDKYNDDMQYRYLNILEYCKDQFSRPNGGESIAIDLGDDYYHYITDLWTPITENNLVDFITVMNYYDNSTGYYQGGAEEDGIGGVINNVAALPSDSNVKLIFGLETSSPAFAPDEKSFYQEGVETLHSFIEQLHNNPLIAEGTAVHKYDSYKNLVSISNQPTICTKTGDTVEITNIPPNIACVMRADTYQEFQPLNGTAVYNNVIGTPEIEMYQQLNGVTDCSGYVSSLQCSVVAEPEPVSCSINGSTLEVTNIPSNIACVMRTDTYQDATPIAGNATFIDVNSSPNIELYTDNNDPGNQNCSGFISEVTCD